MRIICIIALQRHQTSLAYAEQRRKTYIMRKRLMNLTGASFFLAFCLPVALMGQSREQSTQATEVSRHPMLRNILLEEFTGLH